MHGTDSYRIGVFPHHPFGFLFAHCMKFLALYYSPLDAPIVKTFTESHMFNLLLLICLIYCANRVDKNDEEIAKCTSFSANRGYLRCPISLQI